MLIHRQCRFFFLDLRCKTLGWDCCSRRKNNWPHHNQGSFFKKNPGRGPDHCLRRLQVCRVISVPPCLNSIFTGLKTWNKSSLKRWTCSSNYASFDQLRRWLSTQSPKGLANWWWMWALAFYTSVNSYKPQADSSEVPKSPHKLLRYKELLLQIAKPLTLRLSRSCFGRFQLSSLWFRCSRPSCSPMSSY